MSYDWASGSDGKASFGGTDVCVTGWTYTEGGDDADVTHSCSGGIKQSISINTEYTGALDGNVDKDAWPWAAPNLRRGQTGTLLLYLSSTDSISITARIKTFEITSTVDDVISFNIGWEGTAAPTMPS